MLIPEKVKYPSQDFWRLEKERVHTRGLGSKTETKLLENNSYREKNVSNRERKEGKKDIM